MRGGFLLGAVVGAAATTYILSRRNNQINMARMGSMVSNAIGDGFKMMTNSSKSSSSQAAAGGKANSKAQSHDNQADAEQLSQMIAKDASVQKEVNQILSQNSH